MTSTYAETFEEKQTENATTTTKYKTKNDMVPLCQTGQQVESSPKRPREEQRCSPSTG